MKKYNICACLLIKDENEYLPEWLAWHRNIGIEHFFIYDNGSKTPIADSIPPEYVPFCTVVDFSGWHNSTQENAYNYCLTNFGAMTEWLAFIDTDEFIRVVDGRDIHQALEEFGGAGGVAMRWVTYGAGGQLEKRPGPVRERFTEIADYPKGYPCCKSFVRPAKTTYMHAHVPEILSSSFVLVDENHRRIIRPIDDTIPGEKIVVDHYFTRSYEEWIEKMARGSCDPFYSRETEWFERINPALAPWTQAQKSRPSQGGED